MTVTEGDVVQLALPSDPKAAASRLMIAGVAVAGASLLALSAPTTVGPQIQHRAVKLASGEGDCTTSLSNVDANLASIQTEATTSTTQLSTALGNVSTNIGGDFGTALAGF